MKFFLLLFTISLFTVFSIGQINIDYSTFEFGTLNGWMLVNGSETNKWHIGGAESYYNPFSRVGVYISSDGGTSFGYNNSSASVVHMYKDILINTVNDDMILSFKLKCFGEQYADNFRAYILTDFSTPQAGVELDAQYQVGFDEYSQSDYWRGYKFEIKREDVPGNYLRLAFTWKNNNNGVGSSPAAIDNIRLTEWNVLEGSWATKLNLPIAKYYGGSVASGSSLYTLGGDNTGSGTGTFNLSEYDIAGNDWEDLPNYPALIRLNELAKFDSKLFSIGGYKDNASEPSNEVYNFNFNDFSWSTGSIFPKKIFYHRLAVHDWKTLYSVGGSDETNTLLNNVYFLEKGSNTWQEATPLPGDGRADGGFAIVNKRAVYIGGFTNSFDFPVQVDSVFVGVIDPSNPAVITWESRTNFPGGPRARLRAFEWGTNQVIVVGGATGSGFSPLFDDVWLYDIDQDQWSQLTNLSAELCAYFGGTERLASNNWAAVITGGVKTGPLLSASTYVLFDTLHSITSVETIDNSVPRFYSLAQNYPNPFNPITTIQFSIPTQSFVKLEVFNTLGEKISTLVEKELNAGKYEYLLNAERLPSGIYLYRLLTPESSITRKMTLLK